MKKAFVVTSSIEVDENFPLTYSQRRSAFNSDERLRQTVFTIASLDQSTDNDTDIFLIDTSITDLTKFFSYQKNLKYIHVCTQYHDIFDTVRTHPNKSFCETLLLHRLFASQNFNNYDFIFKISGRYFIDRTFDINLVNQSTTDKIFYKKPMSWEWQESWNYGHVDLRKLQNDNTLKQYCSVLFGWGQQHHQTFVNLFDTIKTILVDPSHFHYDIETLGYYLTRPYNEYIIEVPWYVYGWHGADGKFVRY